MRRRLGRWAPAVAIVVVAGVAGVLRLSGDDEPDPEAVQSSAAVFETLDDLVAASDLVVVGTITDVADGRTITSPGDPGAGIRTRLVELDVTDALHGDAPDPLVVEEANAFADGAPIVLDGMTELHDGDTAIWFLVAGGSDAMPYYAVVNSQGRFQIMGDSLTASGDDALSLELVALGPDGLAAAITEL